MKCKSLLGYVVTLHRTVSHCSFLCLPNSKLKQLKLQLEESLKREADSRKMLESKKAVETVSELKVSGPII